MRPPGFWFAPPERPDWRARALGPLAALWREVTARRLAQGASIRPGVPVICVGNITVGGAGKTPVALALGARLAGRGLRVAYLSRGYGGHLQGPVRVDPARHDAAQVGDEPLLLAAVATTWVSQNRVAGARAAEAAGAEVIIMDDGHQNPSVARDVSLVVADAVTGFGNGRVMPAGPLREPVEAGLLRADLLLVLGAEDAQARFAQAWRDRLPCPVVRGRLEPLATGMDWRGLRAYAFAGIGRPEKFFATLRGLGAELAATRALDDHQPLTSGLMARIGAEAQSMGAQLVTTEKDAVRLPPAWRGKVLALPVRLALEDWGPVDAALARGGVVLRDSEDGS